MYNVYTIKLFVIMLQVDGIISLLQLPVLQHITEMVTHSEHFLMHCVLVTPVHGICGWSDRACGSDCATRLVTLTYVACCKMI